MSTIVTIDGPSGAGKTAVAKRVARMLGLPYLPSGTLYRAAAWAMRQNRISLSSEQETRSFVETFTPMLTDDGQLLYENEDITELVQSGEMGLAAAAIAVHPAVRDRLTTLQREFGQKRGCVIEGRSTAIEIFPDATVKIWLTASIDERLKRKQQAAETLEKRDAIDRQRLLAPMQIADGALEIDSTNQSIDETVQEIVGYCWQKIQE
jgi:cytidylate kinase